MNKPLTNGDGQSAAGSSLIERLQAFVGKGGDRFTPARDKITLEGIRKMTDYAGDRNPVYSDPEFAAKSVHGAVVAPPASVMVYWQRGFEPVASSDWVDAQGIRHYRLSPLPDRGTAAKGEDDFFLDVVPGILSEAGYPSLAGVGGELKFLRYPRIGDQLFYSDGKIESVSGPKRLSVGEGYFTVGTVFFKDQNGDVIAEMRNTRMDFAPAAPETALASPSGKSAAAKATPDLRPFVGPTRQLTIKDVSVGQELPSLIVEVNTTLIIAGALAGGDPMDIHHDRDSAKRKGFKDIFMNTMTTHGLVTRFVNDWAGPEAVVEHLAWRLGKQQYPNDDLYLTGKVTAVEPGENRGRITVEVVGSNSLGAHVTSTLRLSLPAA